MYEFGGSPALELASVVADMLELLDLVVTRVADSWSQCTPFVRCTSEVKTEEENFAVERRKAV